MKIVQLKIWISVSVACILMLNLNAHGQSASNATNFKTTNIPKGERVSSNNFTGKVWIYSIESDPLAHWSISKASFAPGAHSNWHKHSGMQVLVVIEGIGYLKERDKPMHILNKGDVVTIQPGVVHWHGATAQSGFVQIATIHDNKKNLVEWLERVTDNEYNSVN
jgi:quercetin dioxygenase-like cupin family protein